MSVINESCAVGGNNGRNSLYMFTTHNTLYSTLKNHQGLVIHNYRNLEEENILHN